MPKNFVIIFCLIFLSINSFSQRTIIDKDSALKIAISDGLNNGLEEYSINLIKDSIWQVRSLLCDDYNQSNYDLRKVNAYTGQIIKNKFGINEAIGEIRMECCNKIERTQISYNYKFDTLKVIKGEEEQKIQELERIYSVSFSPNDKFLLISYDFRKIGVLNIKSHVFHQICSECLDPFWLSNDLIVYEKEFKYLCKYNLRTKQEYKVIDTIFNNQDYRISPNGKWIAYTSYEDWQKNDKPGQIIIRQSMNGQGSNLHLMTMDGKVNKFVTKLWQYVNHPTWSKNSDTILFYIDDKKYYTTDITDDSMNYFPYNKFPNINLWDYNKIVSGYFPYKVNCNIVEINAKTMLPERVLVNKIKRYDNMCFSDDLKYLVFTTSDISKSKTFLWLKRINN
jgi:hypothetical protein